MDFHDQIPVVILHVLKADISEDTSIAMSRGRALAIA